MYVAFESEIFDPKKKKWIMRALNKDGTYQIIESSAQAGLINYRNDYFEFLRERQRQKK